MTTSDDVKKEIIEGHNLAKLAQGQELEKNKKITGTPYLMSHFSDKEDERSIEAAGEAAGRFKPRAKKPMTHKRPLTKREEEIVRLISGGLRNKDVAKTLGISVKTVETHRVNIMNKLALQNLAQLIRYAVQNGLIHIEVDNK